MENPLVLESPETEKYGSDVQQERADYQRSEYARIRDLSRLDRDESHPSVARARSYLKSLRLGDLAVVRDLYYQRALDGDKRAAVAYGTLRMFLDGKEISDRYLLGLALDMLMEDQSILIH